MYENKKLEEAKLLVESREYGTLRHCLRELDPIDVAQLIGELPRQDRAAVFRMLSKNQAVQVFSELDPEDIQLIVSVTGEEELADMFEHLPTDDAVDVLEEMPAGVVKRILRGTNTQTRTQINRYLHYPENSAGRIMTASFVELKADMTVKQAIDHIRKDGEQQDHLDNCYVIGPERELLGSVTIKEILLASDSWKIKALMDDTPVYTDTHENQEQAALLLARYDLSALPVVDGETRLVGVITVDDALEVLEEETTKDLEQMAAMTPSHSQYLKSSVWSLAKNRVVWLLVLMFSAMVTGAILTRYEAAFAAMPVLVSFIPMITDTGGNAGSQSSTMVIRGMGLGEIAPRDGLRVLWKELRVSLLVGVVLALANFLRLYITYPGQMTVAFVVSASLLFTVVVAKCVGGLLPVLAKLCKVDPAVMAAPLITTVVDACALMIYFSIAQRLLGV